MKLNVEPLNGGCGSFPANGKNAKNATSCGESSLTQTYYPCRSMRYATRHALLMSGGHGITTTEGVCIFLLRRSREERVSTNAILGRRSAEPSRPLVRLAQYSIGNFSCNNSVRLFRWMKLVKPLRNYRSEIGNNAKIITNQR